MNPDDECVDCGHPRHHHDNNDGPCTHLDMRKWDGQCWCPEGTYDDQEAA